MYSDYQGSVVYLYKTLILIFHVYQYSVLSTKNETEVTTVRNYNDFLFKFMVPFSCTLFFCFPPVGPWFFWFLSAVSFSWSLFFWFLSAVSFSWTLVFFGSFQLFHLAYPWFLSVSFTCSLDSFGSHQLFHSAGPWFLLVPISCSIQLDPGFLNINDS